MNFLSISNIFFIFYYKLMKIDCQSSFNKMASPNIRFMLFQYLHICHVRHSMRA